MIEPLPAWKELFDTLHAREAAFALAPFPPDERLEPMLCLALPERVSPATDVKMGVTPTLYWIESIPVLRFVIVLQDEAQPAHPAVSTQIIHSQSFPWRGPIAATQGLYWLETFLNPTDQGDRAILQTLIAIETLAVCAMKSGHYSWGRRFRWSSENRELVSQVFQQTEALTPVDANVWEDARVVCIQAYPLY